MLGFGCVCIAWMSGTDLTTASQRVCHLLAANNLGCIVEACDSTVPFLVGSLQDWADAGALVLQCTGSCRML